MRGTPRCLPCSRTRPRRSSGVRLPGHDHPGSAQAAPLRRARAHGSIQPHRSARPTRPLATFGPQSDGQACTRTSSALRPKRSADSFALVGSTMPVPSAGWHARGRGNPGNPPVRRQRSSAVIGPAALPVQVADRYQSVSESQRNGEACHGPTCASWSGWRGCCPSLASVRP